MHSNKKIVDCRLDALKQSTEEKNKRDMKPPIVPFPADISATVVILIHIQFVYYSIYYLLFSLTTSKSLT